MLARPAQPQDLTAITALQRRWDTHWFGAPEHAEAEMRISFDRVDPLAERSRLLLADDGRLLAAAWWWNPFETSLLVDPDVDPEPLYADLLPWFVASGAQAVEPLDRDTALRAVLERHQWPYERSSYELLRDVGNGWSPEPPEWPAGVTAASLDVADTEDVHDLVYERAGWAQVPGHAYRDLEQWRSLFLADDVPRELLVLAREGGRIVGAAMGRVWSDGTGWVSQLAVAADQRGRGLGRALLLEAMRRQVDAGATQLGLSVSADNAGALSLYLGVGLKIDREWLKHRAPTTGRSADAAGSSGS